MALPEVTRVLKSASEATSHSTSMSLEWPCGGVTRVQRMTRSLNGSPLATPWRNSTGMLLSPSEPPQPASGSARADAPMPRTKWRRLATMLGPLDAVFACCRILVMLSLCFMLDQGLEAPVGWYEANEHRCCR